MPEPPNWFLNAIWIAMLWGCGISVAPAQELRLPFERITVEDGLPNPSVFDIMQDQQGFIWFGTFYGVVRYDGYTMKIYKPGYGDPAKRPARDVPRLFQDREGRIWLGRSGYQDCKLFRYEPVYDRFIPVLFDTLTGKGVVGEMVQALIQDKKGRLLAGTMDGGLYVLEIMGDSMRAVQYKHTPGNPNSLISDVISGTMAEDQDGFIWIPTEEGLCRWDPESGLFDPIWSAPDGTSYCHAVLFDPPHTIWAGTESHGLLRIDARNGEVARQYRHDPSDSFSLDAVGVYALAKSDADNLWIKTYDGAFMGLDRMHIPGERFYHVRDANAPGRASLTNRVTIDHVGNLWLSSWQDGVFKHDPGQGRFHLIRFPVKGYQAESPRITALMEDAQGRLWIGALGNGIAVWDPTLNEFTHTFTPDQFPGAGAEIVINSIVEEEKDRMLIASSKGLYQIRLPQGQIRKAPLPEVAPKELSLWPSSRGHWWALDFNTGLYSYAPPHRIIQVDSELQYMITLKEGPGGALWAGANQFGLYRIDSVTGEVEGYLEQYGVHDIHFDRNGIAWLATHSAGLKGFDPVAKSIIHLPPETGEAIGLCRKILEDDSGMLWIITAKGIVQFDPLTRQAMRKIAASNWLGPNEPWYNRTAAGARLRNGMMAFGSASGVLLFHPDSLRTDTLPPQLALTDFLLFNKSVTPGPHGPLDAEISHTRRIVLRHNQNSIGIAFAALHFKNPDEYQYRYRLTPLEPDWVEAGARNTANYAGLKPGTYTFQAQAANADGYWNTERPQLEIVIRRPWWNTRAAQSVYLGILIAIGIMIARFLRQRLETRRLRELDALKSRFYINISHEFRTPLTLILGIADRMKAAVASSLRPDLTSIERNGRTLLRLVNQLLDLAKLESGTLRLKPLQDDVIPFLKYLLDSFQPMADRKRIGLLFSPQIGSLQMDFDAGYLQQVIANLLSNAIKFTPEGGRVEMSAAVSEDERALRIQVKDNGIGIAAEDIDRIFDRFYQSEAGNEGLSYHAGGTGIGLAVTRELTRLMGGSIEVESPPGQGSAFTVRLPVIRQAPPVPASKSWPSPYEEAFDVSVQTEKTVLGQSAPLVLIVEDNAEVRAYLASCLEDNYRLETAPNGRIGFEKAQAFIPDLIISDVMMPEMDGFTLCRKLKDETTTGHIPIILLTARADAESRLEGLELGAEAYMPKPFLKKELLIRILKILEIRKRLQEVYQKWLIDPASAPSPAEADHNMAFVIRIRQIVLERINDGSFDMPQLARAMGMSRTQLHRKVTQLTGESPGRFIRLTRLQRAKELLRNTKESISTIAYQCGFSTPDHFSRVFRQEEGLTPRQFREN